MRALFWNIRGFGARGRRDQLKDLIRSSHIDFVGLVETFKESFPLMIFLLSWVWTDSIGTSYLLRVTLVGS